LRDLFVGQRRDIRRIDLVAGHFLQPLKLSLLLPRERRAPFLLLTPAFLLLLHSLLVFQPPPHAIIIAI